MIKFQMAEDFNFDFQFSETFQKRLSGMIIDSGLTRKTVQIECGISKDIFNRAAKIGVIPGTRSLIKIADYFDVSIEYLVGLTDDEQFIKSAGSVSFLARLNETIRIRETNNCALANKVGIARSLFNTWEKYDYIPTIEILYLLSEPLKVSIDYLLGRTDIERYKRRT